MPNIFSPEERREINARCLEYLKILPKPKVIFPQEGEAEQNEKEKQIRATEQTQAWR